MSRGLFSKAAGCLMALIFVQALILSGMSMTRPPAAGPDRQASLVSFDVCGHGAPSGTVGNFELPPFILAVCCQHIKAIQYYPPTKELAVATADAPDTEKPPET